jgi:hypothetical protein
MEAERNVLVKYDFNTIKVLLHRILNGPDTIEKSKLIEMLTYYTYDSEQFCRKVFDISVGNMLPEPIRVGLEVVIDPDKTGWLSQKDKDIITNATKDGVIYGTVMKFIGYHGYSNYEIGFSKGTIQVPLEAVSTMNKII